MIYLKEIIYMKLNTVYSVCIPTQILEGGYLYLQNLKDNWRTPSMGSDPFLLPYLLFNIYTLFL